MQEGRSGHLKVVVHRVEGYNNCYIILDYAMLYNYRLEVLHKLFHFCKYSSGFFFIFEWLYNSKIVEKLFKD